MDMLQLELMFRQIIYGMLVQFAICSYNFMLIFFGNF